MGLAAVGLVRRTEADDRLAVDQRRAAVVLRGFRQGAVDVGGVMAVAGQDTPAGGLEALALVGAVRQADAAVDGDVVVVPHHDQPAQLLVAGQADRLVADALHQAAVAGDDPGAVIADLGAEFGAHGFLGHGEADGVGNALAERAGRGLDPLHFLVFGMAGGDRTQLAEVLDLLQRHLLVAGQIQQRIDQHRAVTGRQHKAVAVEPVRGRGVELEVVLEQDRRHVGHAHRHAGMAGIGGLDRVHRQHADRAGQVPVVGVGGAAGGDIHAGLPWRQFPCRVRGDGPPLQA